MKTITLIVVHCTANCAGSTQRMADIELPPLARLAWHEYHYLIPTDDAIERGRPEAQVGTHCKNHNSHSFGVAYVGGLAVDGKPPCDTRTETQKSALELLLSKL